MKYLRIIYICGLTLIAMLIAGCSSTRKAVQTSNDQYISASQNEDRHTEQKTGEAVNLRQTVNDITNAVIEFTKTEYNDGTFDVDTTKQQGEQPTSEPRNRESKKPPNCGIKSITTGRITFNNDRTETTEEDIERESKMKSDENIESDYEEDNAAETKSEEKPKLGFIYNLGIIIGALFIGYAIYCIVYGVWRIRKQLKHRLPK